MMKEYELWQLICDKWQFAGDFYTTREAVEASRKHMNETRVQMFSGRIIYE